jgi:DNA-binding transcriptional ArsR family regulator
VHAFDILGDPVRRRILELLADGELTAGRIGEVIQAEFGISQPGVSQHLRVLRESGFTSVRAEGTRRLYAVEAEPLREVDVWLERFREFWNQRLDALGTELARGRRKGTRARNGTLERKPTQTHTTQARKPKPRSGSQSFESEEDP